MNASFLRKLGIKAGHHVLVANGPPGFGDDFEVATVVHQGKGPFDVVMVFAGDRAELEKLALPALAAAKPDAMLWLSFPKGKHQKDLTRDHGWDAVYAAGYEPVTLVMIDDVWSAVRWRPGSGTCEHDPFAGSKEALRPLYERVARMVTGLGPDVATETRKSYIAFTRGRQFAVAQPTTRTRLDVGLRLPAGVDNPRLQVAKSVGSSSITHRVSVASEEDVDEGLRALLKMAYDARG